MAPLKPPDYARIIKECFWDLKMTPGNILEISEGSNFRDKAFLFEKILLNSTELFFDLRIFKPEDLKELIENHKVPQFNYNFHFRRFNMVEFFYLNKPLLITELKWIV